MEHFHAKFEFDARKSRLNREKHGLSLDEAGRLWLVPGVEIEARTIDEPRFLRIGKLDGDFYSCVFTIREDAIRLISARRSRKEEILIYEQRIQ